MTYFVLTTRLPLAVLIVAGIKQWENRSCMPYPAQGQCVMTVSKSSSVMKYANFMAWAERVFIPEVFAMLPAFEQIEHWRGKAVAICDYLAGTGPGSAIWNEGYPVWWHLTNIRPLVTPIPCRGNVGMWQMPAELLERINNAKLAI